MARAALAAGYGTSRCRQQAYRGTLIEQAASECHPWLLAACPVSSRNNAEKLRNQSRCSLALALNDGNFVVGQVVEFIDKPVDLAVERGAFAFIEVLVALRSRGGELLLGFEHLIYELNRRVVRGFVTRK